MRRLSANCCASDFTGAGAAAGVARHRACAGRRLSLTPTLKKLLPDPVGAGRHGSSPWRGCGSASRRASASRYSAIMTWTARLLRRLLGGFSRRRWDRSPRIYIPDRMTEGYGPSAPFAMRALRAEGASLVITVDCGAAGVRAIRGSPRAWTWMWWCWIITGSRLRPACAGPCQSQPARRHIGPDYLCAAGVTFLFLVALNRAPARQRTSMQGAGSTEPDLRDYLDLVGLATVCDVVPLNGVNRAFVRLGLAQLSQPVAPGSCGAWRAWPRPRRLSRPIIWVLSSGRASMPAAG